MYTAMRRLFVLSVLSGGGYAAWSWWQRQNADAVTAAPEWPPLREPAPAGAAEANGAEPSTAAETPAVQGLASATKPSSAAEARWVEPVEDGCPDGGRMRPWGRQAEEPATLPAAGVARRAC